ncbi:MAG: MBG domain-containing protein [Thermomicrobiales bacterium]
MPSRSPEPAPTPRRLSPTALDFGTQPLGTTSAQQSVTVTNTGNGPVVPGAGIVAGPGFAITSDGCASATLTPLQTCSLALTFTATATGPASGTLTLGSQSVTLAGTGSSAPIATTLGVAPASGSYGGTVTLTATLRNSGNSAPLAGKTIDFTVGGASVGTATTDSSGTATLPAVALGTRAAGNYANAVGASFAGDDGALPSSGTANLTVTRALLTITADNQGRAYGFANPTLTLRYDGFVNGDTPAALTGRPTVSTAATASSNAGTYPITVARNTLNSPNYDFTLVNGTLTVTPTPLTITAVDKTRAYGAANPALTVRYSGFRQGDNAGDLNGALTLTTPATTASPADTYPIAVGQGTLASPNYTFLFANGILTITPANTVLSAVSGAATYGGTATLTATLRQSNGTSQPIGGASVAFTIGGTAVGSATTDSSGVATLANVALGGRGAGNYSGLIGASFAGNASQAGDTATGTLRVAKAALVLRATNQARRVGQDNPSCQIQLAPGSTFVNNDTLASLDLSNLACNYDGANRRAPAGTYTITPRGVRSDNYAITYQTGTLTVAP